MHGNNHMIAENTPSSTSSLISSFASAGPAQCELPHKSKASPKSIWQHTVLQSDLPSTVKFVLFALSVGWMDEDGGSCFPALVQIAGKAGLSRQAVARALDQAVEAGYLKRWHWGYGKGNRRWNYHIAAPWQEKVILDDNHRGVIVIENDNHPPVIVIQDDNKPCPSLTMPKESAPPRAPQPETPPPAPAPAPPGPLSAQRTGTPDTLPAAWIEAAQQQRPDLPLEAIQTSGHNFLDYHRSRGTRSADWLSEWRRWIRRERLARPAPVHAPQPPERIAVYHQPYRPVEPAEAEKQAERDAWRARMRKLGVDPDTGERVPPPAPAPRTAAPPLAGHLAELRAALHSPTHPD